MRIVGMMIVGAGEADRYLERSLNEFKRLCDDAVICLNNVDDATRRMVVESGFKIHEDKRIWGTDQWRIKEQVARNLEKLHPDWVISLDADEVFPESVTREFLETKLLTYQVPAWYVYIINLWDSETTHRPELAFWNIRIWRYWGPWGFEFEHKPLHCGLAPKWAYHDGSYAPIILKHYGLMKASDRKAKVKRYKRYDAKAQYMASWYYDWLKSDKPPEAFDEVEVLKTIQEEVSHYKIKEKDIRPNFMTKKWWYVQRDDGSVVDIPEEHLEETLKKHPNWKKVREVGEDAKPSREEIAGVGVVEDPLECKICGFVAKNTLGLSRHKTTHS